MLGPSAVASAKRTRYRDVSTVIAL